MNIAIYSGYRLDSQAWCPRCNKMVRCCQIEYVRLGYRHDTTLFHPDCNTTWKVEL